MLTLNAVVVSGTAPATAGSVAPRLQDVPTAVRLLLREGERIPGPMLPFALLSLTLTDQCHCYCLPLVLGLAHRDGDARQDHAHAHAHAQGMLVLQSPASTPSLEDQVQVSLMPLSPAPPKPAPSLHFRLSPSLPTPPPWLPTALHGHPIHPHSAAANPTRLRAQLGTRIFWVDAWPCTPPPSGSPPLVIAANTTQFIPAPASPNAFQDASQLAVAIQEVGGVRGQQELVQRVASWLMRQLSVLRVPPGDRGTNGGRRVEHALISGSPGAGKSLLANAIAATTGLATIRFTCTSTPTDLLPLTTHLSSPTHPTTPTLAIIDHTDSLSRTQSDLLAHLLDSSSTSPLLVLALSTHPLPAPLTRRLPLHFSLHPPRTPAARLAILSSMLPTLTPTPTLTCAVRRAHGLAPGDLARAAGLATTRALASGTAVADHLSDALQRVTPMALAELAMDVAPVDLAADVYALDEAIKDVKVAVLDPFARAVAGEAHGELARGMLIHGPPGTGKSLVAMGVVSALGFACVPLDASRVLSKIVGASEAAIARAFAAARAAAPCVLLLDQVETLAGHRGSASMGQEGTGDRIVTCLLTELDGILAKGNEAGGGAGVFVVAMSSNIAQIDSALLRPGRLDVHIHLAQPTTLEQARQLVCGFASRHPHALSQHELDEQVSTRCIGMSGAQVKGVWERAAVRAIREDRNEIGLDHLVGVLEEEDG